MAERTYQHTFAAREDGPADTCRRGRLCAEGRLLYEVFLETLDDGDVEATDRAYRTYRRHTVICEGTR